MMDDKLSKKVLLDTDIGSDIDDAVCLAYLLAKDKCDLLGITTVTGEPKKRAMLASAICKNAGKDIPILPGSPDPLLIEPKQKNAPQAQELEEWNHETDFPEGKHIEFMRRTVKKNPKEITLLTIGPLTNVALLFRTDPEILELLDKIVMMCGSFRADKSEWNAINDPHAASIVYDVPVGEHRSVGLDVTEKVTMDREGVEERFEHELLRPVLDFSEVWFEERDEITFHDPLAATTVFNNKICSFESGDVEVELKKEEKKGFTRWKPKKVGRHEIAVEVNPEEFFEELFSQFE